MKLVAQDLVAFLKEPSSCRVVLLYGDDAGMIRQRADTLTRSAAGSLDDPFRIAELSRDEISALAHEAASVSLTGGRRVVRVRDVTDAALDAVKAILSGAAEALVVLEGPALPARSKLRALLDPAPDGVAIGCYPEEGRALEDTIRQTLGAAAVGIDREALAWLSGQLGSDQVFTRAELEKLALYVGPRGRVDLDAAMHCVGDAAGLSLDDALFAATAGDVATADRALAVSIAEGATPVGILRGGLMHLQRLYRARLLVEGGMSAPEATRAARPPLIYRRTAAFTKALTQWSSAALAAGMLRLSQAELACKHTGAPDETLARHALLAIARRRSSGVR
jgi:DNA polymerase-3 subunit delta